MGVDRGTGENIGETCTSLSPSPPSREVRPAERAVGLGVEPAHDALLAEPVATRGDHLEDGWQGGDGQGGEGRELSALARSNNYQGAGTREGCRNRPPLPPLGPPFPHSPVPPWCTGRGCHPPPHHATSPAASLTGASMVSRQGLSSPRRPLPPLPLRPSPVPPWCRGRWSTRPRVTPDPHPGAPGCPGGQRHWQRHHLGGGGRCEGCARLPRRAAALAAPPGGGRGGE